ncbi:GntR family transcriptional regulator [Arthrobacter pigmenti]
MADVKTTPNASGRRPPTAQAFVLEQLRQSIVAGDLLPGQALRQDALAERFGVSRVPLREALKTLEGEDQVVYEPHRGLTTHPSAPPTSDSSRT